MTGNLFAVLLLSLFCKIFTFAIKKLTLADFQAAKGIGNGLVSPGELAQVAMVSSDGRFARSMRGDMLASVMVLASLLLLLSGT